MDNERTDNRKASGTHVHVISHSHWDREWYLPYEQHHVRLIELMDKLIDTFEHDPNFRSFHLDGQTIVLEDYLQVRPEKQNILRKLIQEGKLIIGPWYILQDEFLTSGEANVRNLQIGHRDAAAYSPVSKLGYFPDSFGNMGQAAQLLKQAGIAVAVFGRGVKPVGFNNEIKGDYESSYSELNWESPDGSRVLGILFANWYNNGMEVPVEETEAKVYWEERLQHAEAYASTPHLLFMNGCDHQPVQADLSAALDTARRLFPDITFIHSSFEQYINRLEESLPNHLSTVRGELRSQRTDGWWTLVNTASSRVYIKQANQRSQALLERMAEPLAAFAAIMGEEYPHHLFRYAWKTLMQNHPHDSICGCSVDEVHSEMMTRFAKADGVAEAIIEQSMSALAMHIDTADIAAWGEEAVPFAVINTSGWEKTEVIAVDLEVKRVMLKGRHTADIIRELEQISVLPGRIVDPQGHPVKATLQDMGVRFGYDLPKDQFRQPYMARVIRVSMLAKGLPALGYRVYAFMPSSEMEAVQITCSDANKMENEYLAVSVQENGSYTIVDKRNGQEYAGLGVYEDMGDIGNEYIFRAPDGDKPCKTEGLPARIIKLASEPFRQIIEVVHEWELPESADERLEREQQQFVPFLERKAQRSKRLIPVRLTTRLTLVDGDPQLHVETSLNHAVKDHRLRVLFPTGIVSETHRADSVFEVAVRETKPAAEWTNPSYCQHQQAFVNVSSNQSGITIGNLGLNEYEVLRDGEGTIAVTLIRAVGELGDWGVFPTPGAQCAGEQHFCYSVIPHGSGADRERSFTLAYQNQAPAAVVQMQAQAGTLPAEHSFAEWKAEGLALTAVKMSESNHDLVFRWYNMTGKKSRLELTPGSGSQAVYRSGVLETRGETIMTEQGYVSLNIKPAEILTLCVQQTE
jgi:Alpha-mannosidase